MSLRYLVTKRSHCAKVIPLKGWFFTLVKSRGCHGMCSCRPILRAPATEETRSPFFFFLTTTTLRHAKIKSGKEKLGVRVVAAHQSAKYFKPAWYEFIWVVGCMHSSSSIYNNNNIVFSFSRERARSYSYMLCASLSFACVRLTLPLKLIIVD